MMVRRKQILELLRKKQVEFKFIDSSSSRKLLTAQYTKKNSEDYLAIQINADRHFRLLELTATLVFWKCG